MKATFIPLVAFPFRGCGRKHFLPVQQTVEVRYGSNGKKHEMFEEVVLGISD